MRTNMKKNALFIALGIFVGGAMSSALWAFIHMQAQGELMTSNLDLQEVTFNLEETRARLNDVDLTLENVLAELVTAKEKNQDLNERLDQNAILLQSMKSEMDKIQKREELKLSQNGIQVEKEKTEKTSLIYKSEIANLITEIKSLKSRLNDADLLYAERYRLSLSINDLNSNILKATHKIEASKKSCEQFKKGKSWDRVSEEDCKEYENQIEVHKSLIGTFDGITTQLDKINRQLFSLGIHKDTKPKVQAKVKDSK